MRRKLFALLALSALLASGLVAGVGGSASADTYRPRPGLKLGSPMNGSSKAIQRHLIRSINSTPRGQSIKIITWNFANSGAAKALIKAHRRGVSVQLIMAASQRAHNPAYASVRKALRKGNAGRRPGTRSWAKVCRGSCRGSGGTAHIKIYLFSKVFHSRNVSMWGSANLTNFAGTGQWNDLYTVNFNTTLYRRLSTVFAQAAVDRRQSRPLVKINTGGIALQVWPYQGAGTYGEPVITELNRVRCGGATNGVRGRTKIRVAINAQQNNRGLRIAKKLGQLRRAGCNVRVIYGQFGAATYNMYRAYRVPFRHIVVDRNGDGVYDKYLHNKALVIQGNYAGHRNASVTLFGSANYSALATGSDETFTRLASAGASARYANWVDRQFVHPPKSHRLLPQFRGMRIDPYAKFDKD